MLPSSPLAALACLLATTTAQSWSIIPSNSTSYQPDNASDQVLLGYTPFRNTYLMEVQPLTDYATWDLVVRFPPIVAVAQARPSLTCFAELHKLRLGRPERSVAQC